MPDDPGDDLTEAQKQLYRKKKVPHKFCPYCGTRNEPEADRCSSCNKDISWMKVPESLPTEQRPFQPPRSLPDQKKPIFTWKAILVFILILLAIAALILVIYFTSGSGKAMTAASYTASIETGCTGCMWPAGTCPALPPDAGLG